MNVLNILDVLDERPKFPEKMVDSILDDFHESNGLDLYESVNSINMLVTDSDYRRDDIEEYFMFCLRLIKLHWKPGLGFAYDARSNGVDFKGSYYACSTIGIIKSYLKKN